METQGKKFFLSFRLRVFILVILGIISLVLIARFSDRQGRKELLLQTRLVQKAVNPHILTKLSGSEDDLNLPSYNSLKEQLIAIRSANSKCRFIYLLGRTPEGEIFFFVDSEPADSPDYSPPGQVYNEAPQSIHRVFLSTQEIVEGPSSDRWGTWVSALVPVFEQGKIIGVLGMDIEARTWFRMIILSSLLPSSLFLLIGVLIGVFLYLNKRNEWEKLRFNESRLALQDSENKYRGLFLNFRDAMMIIKPPDWRFISGNPAALEMFKINEEKQLLVFNPADLSPQYQPDGALSSEKAKQMIETALLEGSLFFEWVHKRSDNQEFPANVLLAKMELAGEVMLQVMVRDITKNKKIEEENLKHLQELEVFYRVSMGREERIIELKKEVAMLKAELDKCRKVS